MAKTEAVDATVSGNDQEVGFRALVMKQAIRYNLAGSARNDADMVVHFTLQGDKKRIEPALGTIRKGTPRSSDIEVATKPAAVDPDLNTFTIANWTSSSRHITNKYSLVFSLRAGDEEISKEQTKAQWHQILEKTLDPDDLKNLHPEDLDV